MVVNGLGYHVKKKVLNHHVLDMTQLANRVRPVENSYSKKLFGKKLVRKEKVYHIDVNDSFESNSFSDKEGMEFMLLN